MNPTATPMLLPVHLLEPGDVICDFATPRTVCSRLVDHCDDLGCDYVTFRTVDERGDVWSHCTYRSNRVQAILASIPPAPAWSTLGGAR